MKKYKVLKAPIAILLTITLMVGLTAILTKTTATGTTFTVNTNNATIIGFGGKQWAVIGYDSVGDDTPSDTLTLLLADGQNYGNTVFRTSLPNHLAPDEGMKQNTYDNDTAWYADNPSGMENWEKPNEYRGSTLQLKMDEIAKALPPKENALIIPRELPDVNVENARLWALSSGEVNIVSETLHPFASGIWWLRSPHDNGFSRFAAYIAMPSFSMPTAFLTTSGDIRPALQLNQQSVLFTTANSATGGKSATTIDGNFAELTTSNNIKFTMSDDSLELASVTPTARDGDTITFDYNGATVGETLSAVVMRDGEVAYYGKLVESTSENGTDVELTLPDDYNPATDKVQVFVEEVNGVNETDFASAFVRLCDYEVHDYGEQTDWTVAVYCKVCSFEVFPELPPIEVDVVGGEVEIRNNANVFFSTKGLYLTDGTTEWALPVVVVRARSAVVISGGKRDRIGDLSGVDEVWLVSVGD
ncbi:MAG: hypothetical protein FWH07_00955 [Oscillospiraceae bacterium]|nr:hypothetical protein [Oscillospiraceae bacterium]